MELLERHFYKLLTLIMVVAALIKIVRSPYEIDFSKLSFDILLSMLLAFFSIALSVAFYFKATESSNQFYNNTYKFTKDMSEILGRIEAGFGEKLLHMDKGLSDLASAQKIIKSKESVAEKDAVEKADQFDVIISKTLERFNVPKEEVEALKNELSNKNIELAKAISDVNKWKELYKANDKFGYDKSMSFMKSQPIYVYEAIVDDNSSRNKIIDYLRCLPLENDMKIFDITPLDNGIEFKTYDDIDFETAFKLRNIKFKSVDKRKILVTF